MRKLGFESEKSAGNVFVFFSLRLTSRTIARSVTQYFSSIICYADISGKYIDSSDKVFRELIVKTLVTLLSQTHSLLRMSISLSTSCYHLHETK